MEWALQFSMISPIYVVLTVFLVALAFAASFAIDDNSQEESFAAEWVGFSGLAVLLSMGTVPIGVSLLLTLLPIGAFLLLYVRRRK